MINKEVYYEEDLLNLENVMELIDSFNEESKEEIRHFLNKLSFSFIKESESFRREVLLYFLNKFKDSKEEFIFEVGNDTLCGGIAYLYKILRDQPIINLDNLRLYQKLFDLEFLANGVVELVPKISELNIVFDERLLKKCTNLEVLKLIELTEFLFSANLIKKTIQNLSSLLELYSADGISVFDKKEILDSLLNNNLDKFIACIRKYDVSVDNVESFLENYERIYNLLLKSGVFVYFDFEDFVFNGVATNKNLYPVKYIDHDKNEKILMPFQNLQKEEVDKAYDLLSSSYAIPIKSCKKFTLGDIFSFNGAQEIKVDNEDVAKLKSLIEDEIIDTISEIIGDPNRTAHSPAERADLYTSKLKINNSSDEREVAFIVKGKFYAKVSPREVGHQIIKASKTNAEILILAISGNLFDEARDDFIQISKITQKGYCILDAIDLTKILKMVGKI